MLRNLKLWQKLGMLCLAFVIPTMVLVVLLRQEKNIAIDFAEKERAGVKYLAGLKAVLEGLPLYGMSGDSGSQAKVEGGFRALDAAEREYGAALTTSQRLATLRDQWQKTQSSSDAANRSARTEQLIQSVVDTFAYVGDTSNLILDPDLDSYYTMEAVVRHIAENQRNIFGVVKMVQALPTDRAVNPQERMQLLVELGQLRQGVEAQRAGYAKGSAANPGGQLATLRPGLEAHAATSGAFADRVTRNVVDRGDSGAAPSRDGVEDAAERALAASSRTWDEASKALDDMLGSRSSAATSRKIFAYGIAASAMLLATLIAWLIVNSLTGPLQEAVRIADTLARGELVAARHAAGNDEVGQLVASMNRMTDYLREMANTAQRVAEGDLAVTVNPRSKNDAFGVAFRGMIDYLENMARVSDGIAAGNLSMTVEPKSGRDRFGTSFKNMLERTLTLVQSQDERNQLQKSIMKLLDEVANVGAGDLSSEAEVTADMTGAIADAFNYMIIELRGLITKVRSATGQVSSTAVAIQAASQKLVESSAHQATRIEDTASAITSMATSIQDVSKNAVTSAHVAAQSLANAEQGAGAVQNNIQAMGRIRDQVQETAKRIKRLGERSQEIGEIVKLIDDIADRTSILALNASIQAAMAGEAGRGFAVVAEEVERLAERSTSATKQIDALTKSIQSETNEVVASMEETIREVVDGSSLANEAGQALSEIRSVSQQLAELSRTISEAALRQAVNSESVLAAMSEISLLTSQVSSGTKQTSTTVENLVNLSEDLGSAVAPFKLPTETKSAKQPRKVA
jgi:methyl-accepting chemotaxis protein